MTESWQQSFLDGQVIPALPLALTDDGAWSERHQLALLRYYVAAGAGGVAVGVHSTQFAIRDPQHALYEPLLRFCAACLEDLAADRGFVRIAGVCGDTRQAVREAEFASGLGYHAGLVSPGAFAERTEDEFIEHLRAVADVIPIIGFYLQPAVGGRVLSCSFWRRLCDIENLAGIKIAPFNRYQTGDVVRAVVESGRGDVALYTGNDDSIITDLLTRWQFSGSSRWIAGGLLGQWGVWTRSAVRMLKEIHAVRRHADIAACWLTRNAELTDANAAIFDAAHSFRGCIPGINEVLRRDGLLASARCLDPDERLSAGQAEEIERVTRAYPHLTDAEFIAERRDDWLR